MERFIVTTCPQKLRDILTQNTDRSSTVRIGNKPTGPRYELFRNGIKLTSKIYFNLRFTSSLCYKSEPALRKLSMVFLKSIQNKKTVIKHI